jgi:hypothetical protein
MRPLRELYWSLHADHVAAKDELRMTKKNDPSFVAKRKEADRIRGLQNDVAREQDVHWSEVHRVSKNDPQTTISNLECHPQEGNSSEESCE